MVARFDCARVAEVGVERAALWNWSPLAAGLLTGKYTRPPHRQIHPRQPERRRRPRPAFSVSPIYLERAYDGVEALQVIADSRGVPVAHVAYA
jgi:aryl-alcohol dehydrogenase-like predicted oxidoreductase